MGGRRALGVLLLCSVLCSGSLLKESRGAEVLVATEAVDDSYIVTVKPDAVEGTFEAVLAQCGDAVNLSFEGFEALRCTLSRAEAAAMEQTFGAAVKVEQEMKMELRSEGPRCTQEQGGQVPWGLRRVTSESGTSLGPFKHSPSWGTGVDIYVIDTGVRCSHVEFEGRCRWGVALAGRSNYDGHGHGTHVAATAAGKTYGVAKGANVIAVKVTDDRGAGTSTLTMRGIQWVVAQARRTGRRSVINASMGGPRVGSLDAAANAAVAAGIPFATASGNEGTDACRSSPSAARDVMTVGSIAQGDRAVRSSNYGSCVDIFAPGASVLSADSDSDTDTATKSGTSMASPHVAGAMAVYLADNPTKTAFEVHDYLRRTALRGVVSSTRGSPNLLLHIPCTSGPTPVPPPPTPAPPATPAPLPVPSWCSDAFTETFDSTGSFAYPVSGQYANNQERCFKIQCDGTVTLRWSRFDLEKGYDYVFLLRVAEDGAWTQMWKRDGNQLPPTESHPGDVIVFIRTDQGVTARGFAFSWTCS